MRTIAALGAVATLLLSAPHALRSQQPELVATLERIREGRADSTIVLRVAIRLNPGWHLGAQRPGALGLPTELDWQLPSGWRLVNETWPKPAAVVAGRDTSFTYSGAFAVDALIRKGPGRRQPVRVVLSYGVCSKELCIPGRRELTYSP